MNWKEHAHLFTNGKFQFKRNQIHKLNYATHYLLMEDINDCALIARKVEDMTDEEINNYPIEYQEPVETMEQCANTGRLVVKELLYLLSIGVYPFSQSHFETGEVIDIKTITEETK